MAPIDEDKNKNTDVSSQNRPKKRVNKPLIEKRRRERINECLNQLQSLISQLDKDKCKVGRPAKLEKADILEMTVEFVRKTKSDFKADTKDTSDAHQQWYVAGYTKCMDEIKSFCTENNISADLKTSLQSQIDIKIQQLKCEQAVDLTTKCEKKDSKITEQLNSLVNPTPVIQPKLITQPPTANSSSFSQIQNTSVQIVQRHTTNAPGQVTVLCQKEPATYVLLPTTALCQPLNIPNASQGFPIIVQNSVPNYNMKPNTPEKCGQFFPLSNNLPNSGQVFMLPNSSFSVPTLNTVSLQSASPSSTGNASPPGSLINSSPAYFPAMSTSLTSTSGGHAPTESVSFPSLNYSATNRQGENEADEPQNDGDETVWRPW